MNRERTELLASIIERVPPSQFDMNVVLVTDSATWPDRGYPTSVAEIPSVEAALANPEIRACIAGWGVMIMPADQVELKYTGHPKALGSVQQWLDMDREESLVFVDSSLDRRPVEAARRLRELLKGTA